MIDAQLFKFTKITVLLKQVNFKVCKLYLHQLLKKKGATGLTNQLPESNLKG